MSEATQPNPDALVLEGLDAVLVRGEPAERVIERLFRRNRALDNAARALIARRIFGVACLRRRLAHLVSATGGPEQPGPRELVAAYAVDVEQLAPEHVAQGMPWLDRVAREELDWPADAIERLGTERSLPAWLARRWVDELGPVEADRLAAAINVPGPVTVRANLLKIDRDGLRERLAQEGIASRPTAYSPWGLQLEGRVNVFGSAAWREGLFEVQDEGSQLIALAAAPSPDQTVIDWCAGSGGKTLSLAAMMENRGTLTAADVDARRLADLSPRLARAGVRIVETLRHGGEPARSESADVVLVDAPCSSTGALRRGPDMRWRLSPDEVDTFPSLQLEILKAAAERVRSGGRFVYATCSLLRAENEELADAFLREVPEFVPAPLATSLGAELALKLGATDRLTLLPHRHATDGFFIAAFERR